MTFSDACQQALFTSSSAKTATYLGIGGVRALPLLRPVFAIDLDRQRDSVFQQQIGLDLGPVFRWPQGSCVPSAAQRLFGQMRHPWVEKPDELSSLAQGPAEIGRGRFFDVADGVTQRVGKFIDIGRIG